MLITSGSRQEIEKESLSSCVSSSPPSADLSSAGEEQKSSSYILNNDGIEQEENNYWEEEEKDKTVIETFGYKIPKFGLLRWWGGETSP